MALLLQFNLSDIPVYDINTLLKETYQAITSVVSDDDIAGVQIIPRRWPQKVMILCKNDKSKTDLQESDINIFGKSVEILEAEPGVVKVFVDDAPLDMENNVIRGLMECYGDVREMKNQYLYVDGAKTSWLTGTRVVFMRNVKASVPPTLMVDHKGFKVKLNLHHAGQQLMECRW